MTKELNDNILLPPHTYFIIIIIITIIIIIITIITTQEVDFNDNIVPACLPSSTSQKYAGWDAVVSGRVLQLGD